MGKIQECSGQEYIYRAPVYQGKSIHQEQHYHDEGNIRNRDGLVNNL
jgi:hypothetical protein